MPLYKPSELRKHLEELGIRPKKGLSQNFLLDGNIIRKIIAAADLKPDDVVVEIGPGPGALTEALLEAGATVLAVEKDNVLATALEHLKPTGGNLIVYNEDFLTFDLEKEVSRHLSKNRKAKVIANLPYSLTTPILTGLVPMHHLFSQLVVMVQEEVARRFVAHPKTKDYSSLTVFLNFFSTPSYEFRVSKNCFFPKPRVESAVVKLVLQRPPQVSKEDKFFELTRTSFGQRRKMLRASLRKLYDPLLIEKTLEKIGKPPSARPEELSLNDFLALFEILTG